MRKKIAIIGGGASGMICALAAKNQYNSVDLIEASKVLAKKITISGNGRCNISNINLKSEFYFGDNTKILDNIFSKFDYNLFERFCNNIGLFLRVEDDGKAFPLSYDAKSVVSLFENALLSSNISIKMEKKVTSIAKINNRFAISFEKGEKEEYDIVVVATGSKAALKLGGSEIGYKIAKDFGHTIVDLLPALVQLESDDVFCKRVSGVKREALITFQANKNEKYSVKGDILFTKYGISGFGVLDISFYVSKALKKNQKVMLSLNLLPNFKKEDLMINMQNLAKKYPKYDIIELLLGYMPYKIAKEINFRSNIKKSCIGDLIKSDIKKLVYLLTDLQIEIKGTHGFEFAEVCMGGVSTKEINSNSFESKLEKGLYFVGEILDVAGKRGGYNLAFAWASGYLAGKNIRGLR